VPNLWKGATVVWDNVPIHQGEEIEKAIAEAGARLIYLPPYSPDFNPIENFWSKVKNTLRSIGARTYQALDLALADAYSQVSLKDIRNWFAHSCYCISSSARNAISNTNTDLTSHPQWNSPTGWKNVLNNVRLLVQPSLLLWLIFP